MRELFTRRRVAMLAATPLLLAGLVACGSDSDSGSGSAAASATESAADQPAAGDEIDPKEFAATMADSLDNATTAQISMKIDSTGLAMSATGQVDYSGDDPAMALEMTAPALGDGTIEMRLLDKVMYMKLPMLASPDKFIKIDLGDPNSPMADRLGNMTSLDPRSTLEGFSKNIKSVQVIGPESVGGDDTTHYQVTVSSAGIKDTLGKDAAGVKLPAEFTYDTWLDTDGNLRKMTADVGNQTSIQMEMSHWGDPVDITAPPASQVQEMPGT